MAQEDVAQMGGTFDCPLCHKQHTIHSSYLRHARRCLERTISTPRQKSCRQCSSAKAHCDQNRPCCTRCSTRKEPCEYISNGSQRQREQSGLQRLSRTRSHDTSRLENTARDTELPILDSLMPEVPVDYAPVTPRPNFDSNQQHHPSLLQQDHSLDSSRTVSLNEESYATTNITLNPTQASGNIAPIRNRWLYPYVENSPTRHAVQEQSMTFLCRIFRTYPRMMARRGQKLPPFIHTAQVSCGLVPLPLTNCFVLSRMWEGRTMADGGGELIEATIRQEVARLLNEYRTYDPMTLVAAFQALLVYSIALLFPIAQKPSPRTFELSLLVSLQELGFYIGEKDLILPAETAHTRPSWEEWILVCCRRRTLMALYCFEWIYAMLYGLPTFPCTELGFMPAPAGKMLWNASATEDWEGAYDQWLRYWLGMKMYTMQELMDIKPGSELDLRTEMWLEEADEFGVMYMALVNATEGPHLTGRTIE